MKIILLLLLFGCLFPKKVIAFNTISQFNKTLIENEDNTYFCTQKGEQCMYDYPWKFKCSVTLIMLIKHKESAPGDDYPHITCTFGAGRNTACKKFHYTEKVIGETQGNVQHKNKIFACYFDCLQDGTFKVDWRVSGTKNRKKEHNTTTNGIQKSWTGNDENKIFWKSRCRAIYSGENDYLPKFCSIVSAIKNGTASTCTKFSITSETTEESDEATSEDGDEDDESSEHEDGDEDDESSEHEDGDERIFRPLSEQQTIDEFLQTDDEDSDQYESSSENTEHSNIYAHRQGLKRNHEENGHENFNEESVAGRSPLPKRQKLSRERRSLVERRKIK